MTPKKQCIWHVSQNTENSTFPRQSSQKFTFHNVSTVPAFQVANSTHACQMASQWFNWNENRKSPKSTHTY